MGLNLHDAQTRSRIYHRAELLFFLLFFDILSTDVNIPQQDRDDSLSTRVFNQMENSLPSRTKSLFQFAENEV